MEVTAIFDVLISLLTLSFLEIVLGIDNLVFLSIISARLPLEQRKSARRLGLLFALGTRLLLLASVVWLAKLTHPLFTVFSFSFSGRDLFLLGGGLFLLAKSTQEIHTEINDFEEMKLQVKKKHSRYMSVIFQIAILDIIFSLDSVITAVGLTQNFWIMASAISIAILTMMFLSEPLSNFVHAYPTVKMLALAFLLLIGMMLIADGFHRHVPRGYIYFTICFSLLVEILNIMHSKKRVKRNFSSSKH